MTCDCFLCRGRKAAAAADASEPSSLIVYMEPAENHKEATASPVQGGLWEAGNKEIKEHLWVKADSCLSKLAVAISFDEHIDTQV